MHLTSNIKDWKYMKIMVHVMSPYYLDTQYSNKEVHQKMVMEHQA